MSKKNVARDAFVARVKKSAGHDQALVQLEGFVGDSPAPGYFRLYDDPSLNNYIDIPDDDVVHSEKVSAERSHLGGSIIWLNKDAVFATGDANAKNRPQQKFLKGDLIDKIDIGKVGFKPKSFWVGCNSGWHTCRSHFYTDCFQSKFFNCEINTIGTILTMTKASLADGCPSQFCPTDRIRDVINPVEVKNPSIRRFNDAGFGRYTP